MTGIYKITNPKGKIYIGQSTNIEKRKEIYKKLYCKKQIMLYNSIKKYGWENHKFEILEECSIKKLNEREKYWGSYYNVLEKGLNLRLGNGRGSCSNKVKEKISISNSKPKPEGFGNIISKANKGKKRSEKSKLKQSKTLKGREGVNKGKKWEWNNNKYCIVQYDLEGKFIKKYKTTREAIQNTNIKGINECIRGTTKTSGGYIWKKYPKDFPKCLSEEVVKYHNTSNYKNNCAPSKPICVYNLDMELIYEFPSITIASEKMGKHPSNISAAVRGKKKNYLNLIWKYKN